jgi:hypothetical protein
MVDQLRRRLALGLPHGIQNTRLGNPAEIVVDGRSPAGLHHVEPDRARQHIGLVETRANAMGGDATLIVAIGWLMDGVDRKRRTVGEQRRLCTTIESRQRIPEIVSLFGNRAFQTSCRASTALAETLSLSPGAWAGKFGVRRLISRQLPDDANR